MGAPVIALVGQIASFAIDQGHGHLHEIHDQLGLLRHITRHAARIRSPHEASGAGRRGDPHRVRRPAGSGGAGMRDRRVGQRGGGVAVSAGCAAAPPPVDPAAVPLPPNCWARRERPLIVVGGGALDAGAEVQAVAEALQAPVSSFRRGRGVIPTTHPLAVSFTEGHALWKDADAVLAIGTRLYWQQSELGRG